ncbi:MAG TPA: sodium/proton-translocating pyrophosphatase, partial [Bacteroidia bacterium]|nr:sodium/proton-translocating pyrophosphatase [Bacteroidia bacterium]HRH82885.1 sodium/proton-translocating pyrophosphatase [Bacteroidia bacterium]
AALTSLALFAAFVGVAGISHIDIYKANVLAGLFVGAMIPFIFSSLAIAAVGRAAMSMVEEVRRQFREIPGIMEYKAKPEYEKCVAISTEASIREMIAPGALALIVPVVVGFIFGPEVLGGVLAGVTVSGVLMGMFQSNAGGAWDNAKKSFEKGVDINGQTYYKGSEPHKASVTGDTVGDPFKDTSGPSMNILIKLMSIVSLIIAPHIASIGTQDSFSNKSEAKVDASAVTSTVNSTPEMDLAAMAGTISLDVSHSWMQFGISHFLTTANGTLAVDTGYINITNDLATSTIFVQLNVKSIDTKNTKRNNHLLSSDFFDAEKFPVIVFKSNKIEKAAEGSAFRYIAKGELTIKDITKPVELRFNYMGALPNEYAAKDAHTFVGEADLDRIDFSVGESGPTVGNKVKATFSVEGYKI